MRYFKEDEKGVDNMCKAMEEMRAEAAAEAAAQKEKEILDRLRSLGVDEATLKKATTPDANKADLQC